MTLTELLAELRLDRGLSQEALAELAAVSVRAIRDIERGATRRPHRDTVRALARALALTADESARFEQAARRAPPVATRRRAARPPALPAPVTSIVGRGADVGAVVDLIRRSRVRLVTITGPGGVGKTRLAIEAGWRVYASFERVDTVDLSPLRDAHDVPATIAMVLGCAGGAGSPAAAVTGLVRDRRWLLLLDSFEHVADAAGELAGLLAACPGLTLLVTSRVPVRLRGEHLWPLATLPVPAPDVDDPTLLTDVPAVALLVERTRAVRPGFALTRANALAVASLCRRLDGLPLAIELAAARLRTQEPADLLRQLDSRLTELAADAVDVPERHRTLHRTVEWSTERLAAPDRLVLGVLAVFPGDARPAAVSAVLAGSGLDPAGLEASLSVLAASSLISVVDRDGAARIGMLDTIRELAVGLLDPAGLATVVRGAHAAYFLGLVREGAADPIDRELDNVRAAVAWAVDHQPSTVDDVLVKALMRYYLSRSYFAESGRVFAAIAAATTDDAARAWAWNGAGIAANETGDLAGAIRCGERAAELFDGIGDRIGRTSALTIVGAAHQSLGHYEQTQAAYLACLDLAWAIGNQQVVAVTLNNLGAIAQVRGDFAAARDHHAASLRMKRELADRLGIAETLANLGALDNELGRYHDAYEGLRESVDLFRGFGERHRLAWALTIRAEAELGLGEPAAAAASLAEAIGIARRVEARYAIGLALSRLGDLAVAEQDSAGAERHYREALEYLDEPREAARAHERLAKVRAGSTHYEAPNVGAAGA